MKYFIPLLTAFLAVGIIAYFLLRESSASEPIPELHISYTGDPKDHIGKKILLVAIYAEWASVWRSTAQVLSELDREKYDIQLINADSDPERVKSLGIDILPTLIVFENGKEASRHPNLMSADQLP